LVLAGVDTEDSAPAATAGEEQHSDPAMSEDDLRVAAGQPEAKVEATPPPAPVAYTAPAPLRHSP
jgi:hypothetical protein